MRRAREIWVSIIRQYEQSGQTQEEFAGKRGIPVGTLRAWIYRLRRAEEAAEAESALLLPVRVVASPAPTARQGDAAEGGVQLEVGDTLRLRFPAGTSPAAIAQVVALLRAAC